MTRRVDPCGHQAPADALDRTGPRAAVGRLLVALAVASVILLTASWADLNGPTADGQRASLHLVPQARAAKVHPVVAAAGDIACEPKHRAYRGGNGTSYACQQKAVSDLLVNTGLTAVLPLGDNQYECGGFEAYMQSYDPTWGRVKGISFPVIGNHEYQTSSTDVGTQCDSSNAGAKGTFDYFGARLGPSGYYSFDLGRWHLIALNSQCGEVGGCGPSSPQGRWLRADLAGHDNFCTMAYWHIPLFSSGGRAKAEYKTFWDALYAADADLVLAGHDHTYERFAPQNPSGGLDRDRGLREFVVGTGGGNHTEFASVQPHSEVRNADTFGVLRLRLRPTSYSWRFVGIPGSSFTDNGRTCCH